VGGAAAGDATGGGGGTAGAAHALGAGGTTTEGWGATTDGLCGSNRGSASAVDDVDGAGAGRSASLSFAPPSPVSPSARPSGQAKLNTEKNASVRPRLEIGCNRVLLRPGYITDGAERKRQSRRRPALTALCVGEPRHSVGSARVGP